MPTPMRRPPLHRQDLDEAREYNLRKRAQLWNHLALPNPLRDLSVDQDAFTLIVHSDQFYAGITMDGKLGPQTLRQLYPEARSLAGEPGSGDAYSGALELDLLATYVDRARRAVGHNIHYKLGKGGFRPGDTLPDDHGECDCSGFIAWVLRVGRSPQDNPLNDWFETTRVHADATGNQRMMVAIKNPVSGCVVVYPDNNGREGHIGLVTQVNPLRGVDCSGSRNGIYERDIEFFNSKSERVFAVTRSAALDLMG